MGWRASMKPGDVEQTLRQLLDQPDIQVYDCHMILQILRKKYNKNFAKALGGTVKYK